MRELSPDSFAGQPRRARANAEEAENVLPSATELPAPGEICGGVKLANAKPRVPLLARSFTSARRTPSQYLHPWAGASRSVFEPPAHHPEPGRDLVNAHARIAKLTMFPRVFGGSIFQNAAACFCFTAVWQCRQSIAGEVWPIILLRRFTSCCRAKPARGHRFGGARPAANFQLPPLRTRRVRGLPSRDRGGTAPNNFLSSGFGRCRPTFCVVREIP